MMKVGKKLALCAVALIIIAAFVIIPVSSQTGNTGGGGGGGGGAAAVAAPTITATGVTSLAIATDGSLQNSYNVGITGEVVAALNLPVGTIVLDAAGNPLSSVSIAATPAGNVPAASGGFTFAGLSVTCSPAGATFSPPITLTFELTPEQIQTLEATGEVPSVQWYNGETNQWEFVPTTYNLITGQVTASVSHFSIFAVFYQPASGVTTPVSTPAAASPTAAPAAPTTETAPFPWMYVIIGVVVIILIAGGAYYYTQQK